MQEQATVVLDGAHHKRRQVFGGLWRNRDFMRLWSGMIVSEFGTMLGALGLTAMLLLQATPIEMGILATAGSLPVLLVGLQAGVWVDRVRRRPLLIVSDLLRALLVASVPLAWFFGVLRIEHLYVVAFLSGVLGVLFNVAHQSYLPSVVQREHIFEGNAKLNVGGHIAEISSPAVGGLLVQVLSIPLVLVIDALSFVWSALVIGRIRSAEPAPPPVAERQRMWADVREGLRTVGGNPLLRAIAGSTAVSSFFGSFYAAIYGLYLLRTLGLSPALIGVTIGAGGAGALVGALFAERVARAWGPRGSLIGGMAVMAAVAPILPLAGGSALVALTMLVVGQFVGDMARAVFVVGEVSLRQAITPDRLLGRTNASMHFLAGGLGALGMLVGGFLGETIGLRTTAWIAALGDILALLWLVMSPIRGLGELPEPTNDQ